MDTKPWYESKTVYGAVTGGVPAVVILLKIAGVDIADLANNLTAGIIAALGLIGTFVAIYGRLTAKTVITPNPPSSGSGGYIKLLIAALLPALALGALATAPLALTSCAKDVVGKAEQTTHATATGFDTFLQFELDNRAQLLAIDPGIHALAQKLRHKECPTCDPSDPRATQNGIRWLQSARAYTEAYRLNRTKENKFQMDTALALVSTTLDQIAQYYVKAETTGVKRQ